MKDLVSDGFAQVVKPYIDAQDKTTREILAPVETDETDASRAYQIGDQLILGGILYDVIAPISQHGIITSTGSGANIEEADNITDQIDAVNDALANLQQTGTTASQSISVGTFFYLNGSLVRAIKAIPNGATFTQNTNYKLVTAGSLNEISQKLLIATSGSGTAANQLYGLFSVFNSLPLEQKINARLLGGTSLYMLRDLSIGTFSYVGNTGGEIAGHLVILNYNGTGRYAITSVRVSGEAGAYEDISSNVLDTGYFKLYI